MELDAEKFAKIVYKNNPQVLIDRVNPLLREAIFAENFKQRFNSQATLNYGQNQNLGSPRTNLTSFRTGWSYTTPPVGTTVGVNLGSTNTDVTGLTVPPGLGGSSSTNFWVSTTTISLSQPLLYNGLAYLMPQRILDIDRYATRIEKSAFNAKASQNLLAALQDYYNYLISIEKLSLLKNSLAKSKEILSFNRRKARSGTLNRKDLLANQAQVLKTEVSIDRAEINLENLENKIFFYMGYRSDEAKDIEIKLLDDTRKVEELKVVEAESFNTALSNRDDVTATKLEIEAAQNAITIGKATLFPTLNATFDMVIRGTGDTLSSSVQNFSSATSNNQGLDFRWGLNFAMYTDLLSYKITTARPRLQLLQARRKLDKLEKEILNQVKASMLALKQTKINLGKNDAIFRLQRERYTLSRRDYLNGKIDFSLNSQVYIDLETAQADYLDAKLAYYSTLLSHYNLEGTLIGKYLLEKLDIDQKAKLKNVSDYIESSKNELE